MTDETTDQTSDEPPTPQGVRATLNGVQIECRELQYLGVDITGVHQWTAMFDIQGLHVDLLPGNTAVGFSFRAPTGQIL